MPVKCVAIDDEPLALELMQKYITDHPGLELLQTFDDAVTAFEFLKQSMVDLLFVDINMPDITGLDLVRSLEKKPMVIFTTAYKKFAIDGFELDAIDYLLKPISYKRFSKAVSKALEYFQFKSQATTEKNVHLFVYAEYRMLKIDVNEIDYIESLEDYIKIHLLNQKPVMTLMTLKAVLEKLPSSKFKRIHRSYIVATGQIKSVLNKRITLLSSAVLPVSDSYLDIIQLWKENRL